MKLKRTIALAFSMMTLLPVISSCDDLSTASSESTSSITEEEVKNWFEEAWDNTIDWGTNFWTDLWDKITHWGRSTWQSVVDWSTNTGEAVADWGQDVIDGTKHFFCGVGDYVVDLANKSMAFCLKKGVDHLDLTEGLEETDKVENWDEYKNDPEVFTYALISNQMKKAYDVFPAKIYVSNTNSEVYGYAFTDYEQVYAYHENQPDEELYYGCGFLSLIDEPTISDADIQAGLEVIKTESDDSENHYFYSYNCEPFTTHCVVQNKYLKYGVNENHQIFYDVNNYDGTYDTSLGGLYSFDEKKYIYGEDNGFIPTKGSVIKEAFDVDNWKDSVKSDLLRGFNLKIADLRGVVSSAIKTVKTVINNLNEQTVLGYSLNDIKKAVGDVSEGDVATISDEKVAMHAVNDTVPKDNLSATARWIVGAAVGVSVIATIAVALFFPKVSLGNYAINTIVSAISGAVIEFFVESVVMNQGISDVDWIKVGIAAAVGGVTSLIPFTEMGKGWALVTSSSLAAITTTLYQFLDGASFLDCTLSFVSAFALAVVTSTLLSLLGHGLSKLAQKMAPKLTTKVQKFIYNHQVVIGGKEMNSSANSATRSVKRGASQSSSDASSESKGNVFNIKKAMKHLPSDHNRYFCYTNESGDVIKKREAINLMKKGQTAYLSLKDVKGGNPFQSLFYNSKNVKVDRLPIVNGYVQFRDVSTLTIKVRKGDVLLASRNKNFHMFDDSLKDLLINDPNSVPQNIRNYFDGLHIDYENLTYSDFDRMQSTLGLTWHECEDRHTGVLISTALHSSISHMGGFALAKALVALSYPYQLLFMVDMSVARAA